MLYIVFSVFPVNFFTHWLKFCMETHQKSPANSDFQVIIKTVDTTKKNSDFLFLSRLFLYPLNQCVPNFLLADPLLDWKYNHGSSHHWSHKYSVGEC